MFGVCSQTSGHGVAAAVVATPVSSFPESELAVAVEHGLLACWIILHSSKAFVMLT